MVGGGAAMAAHGSSLSREVVGFAFNGCAPTFGGGAAIEPHKSSSAFPTCEVDLGRGIEAKKANTNIRLRKS